MTGEGIHIDDAISRLWPEAAVIRAPAAAGLPVDRFKRVCVEQASERGDREVVGVLLEGRIPDAILLASPPTTAQPRWLFVMRGQDGRYSLRGWGWTIDDKTASLFDFQRAEAIIQAAEQLVESRLGGGLDLYLSNRNASLCDADPELVDRALRLIAEQDDRWRCLDVDGEMVICRAERKDQCPLGFFARIIAWLRSRHSKPAPDRGTMEEMRVVLAVRCDRQMWRVDQLKREEADLIAGIGTAQGDEVRLDLEARLAAVREQIRGTGELLELLRSQRSVIETHLHQLDLVRTGQDVELPDGKKLLDQAVAVSRMAENMQQAASLARAADRHASEAMPGDTERFSGEMTINMEHKTVIRREASVSEKNTPVEKKKHGRDTETE